MIFNITEARDILRIDGTENDAIITPLVEAIPSFLEHTTGYRATEGNYSPVAMTAARFILHPAQNSKCMAV